MDYNLNQHLQAVKEYELQTNNEAFFISDWSNSIDEVVLPYKILEQIKLDIYSKYLEYDDVLHIFEDHLNFIKNYCNLDTSYTLDMFLTHNSTSAINLSLSTLINRLACNDFLIIKPNYFSIENTLKQYNCNIHEFYLNCNYNHSNIENIRNIFMSNKIDVLVLTNPIYGLGKTLNAFLNFDQILEICYEFSVWLVIDNVYDGLSWNNQQDIFINATSYQKFLSYPKTVLIDSPSKKLFLNSIKFGIVYSNEKFIDNLDIINDYSHGSFSELSVKLLQELYSDDNINLVKHTIMQNLTNAQNNYHLYKNLINQNTSYFLDIDNGYNTMMFFKDVQTIDINRFVHSILLQNNIVAIPNREFNYSKTSDFAIRINLLKKSKKIETYLNDISSFNFNTFN